jgi:hypothetical protein
MTEKEISEYFKELGFEEIKTIPIFIESNQGSGSNIGKFEKYEYKKIICNVKIKFYYINTVDFMTLEVFDEQNLFDKEFHITIDDFYDNLGSDYSKDLENKVKINNILKKIYIKYKLN